MYKNTVIYSIFPHLYNFLFVKGSFNRINLFIHFLVTQNRGEFVLSTFLLVTIYGIFIFKIGKMDLPNFI